MSPGHLGQAAGGVGEPGEDLVPFPLGVGTQLVKFAGRVFANPRGLRACIFCACAGGRSALVRTLGGLPVLLGLLARPVPVGLGGADEGLGIGAYLAGQLLGLPLGFGDPGLGGIDCGVGVGLCSPDRLVGAGLRLVNAGLSFAADRLQFGGVRRLAARPGRRRRRGARSPRWVHVSCWFV